MLPAVALEYGQIWWVRSISAAACSSSSRGVVNSSSTASWKFAGGSLRKWTRAVTWESSRSRGDRPRSRTAKRMALWKQAA